jgi:hypothetical protein
VRSATESPVKDETADSSLALAAPARLRAARNDKKGACGTAEAVP